MDYISYCKDYFDITGIPVSLMDKDEALYSTIGAYCSIETVGHWKMAPLEHNPNFYRYSPDIEYGGVSIEGTDYTVFLGPVFSVPVPFCPAG